MTRLRNASVRCMLAIVVVAAASCNDRSTESGPQTTGAASKPQDPKALQEDFEKTYRAWYAGFASDKPADREKTLHAMWPTKEDIEYLVPKHAAKLWPRLQDAEKHYLKNIDKLAAEFTKGGPLKKVEVTDVRKDDGAASGDYKRVLAMIPADVPVFTCSDEHEQGNSSHSGDYLYRNGRWFWFKDIFVLPKALDELDKADK